MAGDEPIPEWADASLRLAPELTAVAEARMFVAHALHDCGLHDLADDVALVTGELVTNAVLHARSPVEIRIAVEAGGARVEVADDSAAAPVTGAAPAAILATTALDSSDEPDLLVAEQMTGRGLVLVDGLSSSWGWHRTPTGKVVWASFGDAAPSKAPTPGVAPVSVPASSPVAQAGDQRPVRLLGVPVRLVYESDANLDDLTREFQVGSLTGHPAELVQLAERLLARLEAPRDRTRDDVQAAIAAGSRVMTTDLVIPEGADADVWALVRLLDEIAAFCEDGTLLSLAPSAELRAFRHWVAAEVERQLAGSVPLPCPFPVLRSDDPVLDEAARESDALAPTPPSSALPRLLALQEVAAELAHAQTLAEVSAAALTAARSEMGAETTSLSMLADDGETVELVEAIGYAEDVLRHWRNYSVADDLPASEAIRTGRPVFLRAPPELFARYPAFRTTPTIGSQATAVLPLAIAPERRLGAMALGFGSTMPFDDADRAFLNALASCTGQAVARVRLLEAERRSLERITFLSHATEALNRSLDMGATTDALIAALVPRVGDWCSIYLSDAGRPRLLGVGHVDAAQQALAEELQRRYPPRPERPNAITRAIELGESLRFQVMSDHLLEAVAEDDEHLRLLRELSFGSGMILPITSPTGIIGAIGLGNEAGRLVTDEEFELALDIAARAGAAYANSLQFRERSAAAEMLQASLLPAALPAVDRVRFDARYRPASQGLEVGGDFYDVIVRPDGVAVAVIGDVRGHGVEAAAVAAVARHTVRALADRASDPIDLLQQVNRMLLADLGGTDDEPRLCSLAAAFLDTRHGEVSISLTLAGHPSPFVRSADGDVSRLDIPGDLLGVRDDPSLGVLRVALAPGDALVLFTDGVVERHSGAAFFDDEGVERSLRAVTEPASLADSLLNDALAFVSEQPHDDMAVLVITRT